MTKRFVHKVLEGPTVDNFGDPVMVCIVQDEGDNQLYEDAIYSQDEDDLWEIVRWLKWHLEPFTIDLGDDGEPEEYRIGQD